MPRENAIARIAECGPQPYAAPPSSLGGPLGERCAVREDPAGKSGKRTLHKYGSGASCPRYKVGRRASARIRTEKRFPVER